MNYLTLLDQLPIPAGIEAELFVLDTQRRLLGLIEDKPDICQFSTTLEGCLRVQKNGGESVVTSTDLEAGNLGSLLNCGIELAVHTPEDPHRRFASAFDRTIARIPWDEEIFHHSSGTIFDRLEDLRDQVHQKFPAIKKFLKLHFHEIKQTKSIANTSGLNGASTKTTFVLMGEFLAEEAGQVEVGWDVLETRFENDLVWDEWVLALAEMTIQSMGGRPLSSGQRSVILHPRVGAQFLTLIAHALSAEAAQRGRSYFKEALGKSVASDIVSMADDPFLSKGVATDSFDDEGILHDKIDLIVDGVLKDYFYDIRTASRVGRLSNGHGLKETLASPPRPGSTNLYIKQGTSSLEEMLMSEDSLFLIRDLMGLHTADPVTGEFSFGAAGLLYANGRLSQSVRGVTVSGKVSEVLKNIKAVGNQVEWHGSFGSPYLLVAPLEVVGVS